MLVRAVQVASVSCDTCGATVGYDSSASSTYEANGEEFTVDDGSGMGGTGTVFETGSPAVGSYSIPSAHDLTEESL